MIWDNLPKAIIKNQPISKITGRKPLKGNNIKYSCIVEVTEPNYVPSYMQLRSTTDATMFTAIADFSKEHTSAIEADPKIKSVAVGQRLYFCKPISKDKKESL
jgi:hypothetical protein